MAEPATTKDLVTPNRAEAAALLACPTDGPAVDAIAALVALDPDADVVRGVRRAKEYLTGALRAADGLSIGRADATGRPGHGPVHHFAGIWPDPPAPGLRA